MSPDDDARDLLAAYALDAVDDVERRSVERLIARDAQAADEVAGLRATAAMLGSAMSAPPPPTLRADVLAAITRTPQSAGPATRDARDERRADDDLAGDDLAGDDLAAPWSAVPPATTAPTAHPTTTTATSTTTSTATPSPGAPVPITAARSARAPRRTTTWLAIAATAVGAAVVPSVLAVQQARQTERAEQQAQALTALLADPGATVVRGDVAGGGTAVGVLTADAAVFTATGLAEPGAGREYQLWVLRDGAALPAGVMPDDDGTVRALADDYRAGDGLAVTVEPAGGSETPTSDPVVVLTPTEA